MNEAIKYFLRFCKDENLIVKYPKIILGVLKRFKNDTSSYLTTSEDYCYKITDIFNHYLGWQTLPEGHSFWYEIHMKWENFIFDTPYGHKQKIELDFNYSWYRDKDETNRYHIYLEQKQIFETKCQQHLNTQN